MSKPDSKISRREFVIAAGKTAGLVTVAMKSLPLALASSDPTDNCRIEDDFLVVQSGRARVFPSRTHVHTIDIPLDVFKNAPERGIRLKSTVSQYPFRHSHEVRLSQVDVMSIALGETIVVNDRNFDHRWAVYIPRD